MVTEKRRILELYENGIKTYELKESLLASCQGIFGYEKNGRYYALAVRENKKGIWLVSHQVGHELKKFIAKKNFKFRLE